MSSSIIVKFDQPIATITLNRPEKRNAISPQMLSELFMALDRVEAGPARVAIISGEGPSFCSGMDLLYLSDIAHQTKAQNMTDARRIASLFRRLWSFSKPLIAAVHGPAMAGGCGVATLCDFTLASENATFGYTEVRVGFMPALVSLFLERQVGEKVARDLLLTGRVIDAHEAMRLGLVTRVVPADKLMSTAQELAASLIAYSPGSLTFTKRLLVRTSEAEIERGIELAIEESAAIRATADFREGLAAFLNKRKPQWTGQ